MGTDKIRITRFEVIDHTADGDGRAYGKRADQPFKIEMNLQDEGRTLKIFLSDFDEEVIDHGRTT